MKLGFISSGALHLLVVLIVWLGLPHIKRDPPKLDELIFVKLADVAKVTNLPPDIDTQPKKKSKTKSPNTKQSEKQKRASTPENKKPQSARDKTVPVPEAKPRARPKPAKLKATKPKTKPKPRPIVETALPHDGLPAHGAGTRSGWAASRCDDNPPHGPGNTVSF